MTAAQVGQKTIVITGGNSGIGFETAKVMAQRGWRVIITGRNENALKPAVAGLDHGGEVSYGIGDFTSFSSVCSLADQLLTEDRIDVLLNNVGIALTSKRVTPDGNDMMVQVNHLSPFLLTNLLLEKLKANTPTRIVNVSSNAHRRAESYGFDDFQFERRYSLREAYPRTKLYNVMFTRELARRLEGTGVTANALHPGVIQTRIGRDGDATGLRGLVWPIYQKLKMDRPEVGSKVTCFVATAPELEGVSGEYYSTRLKAERPNPLALDDTANQRLWEVSCQLVDLPLAGSHTSLDPPPMARLSCQ